MDKFDQFNASIQASLAAALKWGDGKLYTSNAKDLDLVYLRGFANPIDRQYHNCSACKSFLRRYGGLLVTNGKTTMPALWDGVNPAGVPEHFQNSHAFLSEAVREARITGVFASSAPRLGQPETNGWTHFWVNNPKVHDRRVKTAGQWMAEVRQDFLTLRRGLDEFSQDTLDAVAASLAAWSPKFAPTAQRYADLKRRIVSAPNQQHRDMVLFHALANAGPGFAGIKGSALGSFYKDLSDGMPMDAATNRFKAVTNPWVYQQPTAAPKAGNIKRAEEIFAALGLEPALHRRVASFDEVRERCAWLASRSITIDESTPVPPAPTKQGIFAALREPQNQSPLHQAASKTSLRKFMEGYVRGIDSMQIIGLDRPHSLGTITTAVHPEAPSLFAWSGHCAWYRWFAAPGKDFGLSSEAAVLGVLDLPSTWFDAGGPHKGLMFVLQGAKDTNNVGSGICAEGLRADLHEVKRTIVAHSLQGTLLPTAPGVQGAAGLIVRQDGFKPFVIRTFKGNVAVDFAVTSWE